MAAEFFLCRLSVLLREMETDCYAWVLLDNHFHLLLKPRAYTLASLMRRLLSGYAVTFNLRHNRSGHLFQNRYKSVVCDENPYLLELIRYIHLNPVRAGIIKVFEHLLVYPWSGHGELLEKSSFSLIDTGFVLSLFDQRHDIAQASYTDFLAAGLKAQKGVKLSRGGKRVSRAFNPALSGEMLYDDRILGGGSFVENLAEKGVVQSGNPEKAFDDLISQVAEYFGVATKELRLPWKTPRFVQAKAVICHVAVRYLGVKGVDAGKRLGYSSSAVSHATPKGARLLNEDRRLVEILGQTEKL